MEDWQLDQACLAEGICPDSPESLFEELEEAVLSGEITEHEATLILLDYTSKEKRKMKKPSNLLDTVITTGKNGKTEQELKLLYKATINALTSAVATNVLAHISNKRRIDATGLEELHIPTVGAGAAASLDGEPTLDQRNAADMAQMAADFGQQMTADAGHLVAMPPLEIAELCDGIRHSLYKEFEAIVDLADEKALYRNPPGRLDGKVNFDQPMSLEFNLAFRIQMAGQIDERRAEKVAKEDNMDIDFIRNVMRQDSERLARNLAATAPEVVMTAEAFTKACGREAFESLPLDTQIRIGTKIADTINKEYQRLYGVKIRNGSLEVAQQCYLLKALWEEVKKWTMEAERIMNENQVASRS